MKYLRNAFLSWLIIWAEQFYELQCVLFHPVTSSSPLSTISKGQSSPVHTTLPISYTPLIAATHVSHAFP